MRTVSLLLVGAIAAACGVAPTVTPGPIVGTPAASAPLPRATTAAPVPSGDLASSPAPAASPTPLDVDLYTGLFQNVLREVLDVHIVGFEQVEVTEERVFIWVDSNSTEDVMKEVMYRLYDEIAGGTPDHWSPDVVIRMGSNYNNDWLQSTTSSSSDVYSQIDEQLEWEFFSVFERQGQTF